LLTLLHISDLHFGPYYHPEVGEQVQEFARGLEPDVIAASGDFTQRARREQFREARDFLERLPTVPLIVTPGNHDVPLYRVHERLLSPYALYREYISEELDSVTAVDGGLFVALNSTSPHRAVVNGRIHGWQLDFARGALEEADPDSIKVVVAHHHFAPPPDFEGGQVMPRAKRALDLFSVLGVDLILGGHMHRAYVGNSLDVYPGQRRDHGIVIGQSGTSTSRRGRAREREKNTLNVLRLDTETIRITHYMYFDEAGSFMPISRHIFFRGGRSSRAGSAGRGHDPFETHFGSRSS
jgi:3',5'-cyclic AMP phosphodiesterase CpdA